MTGFMAQFGCPLGPVGYLVAGIMALENRRRLAWVVEQLKLGSTDRLLEVGCGPGVALRYAARRIPGGHLIGVDLSEPALRMAHWLNLDAIAQGKIELRRGDAAALPLPDQSVDQAYGVNTMHHWPNATAGLKELWRVLRAGGQLTIAEQPRHAVSAAEEEQLSEGIQAKLADAGFTQLRVSRGAMRPAPTLCVQGIKADKTEFQMRHG